jgi:hypothetical protein
VKMLAKFIRRGIREYVYELYLEPGRESKSGGAAYNVFIID